VRVEILRDRQTRAGRVFRKGRTYDLSDGEARVLIRRGIAKAIRAKKPTLKKRRQSSGQVDTANRGD